MRRPIYRVKDKRYPEFDGYVEDPKVDAFIAEILQVCEKHGMTISHEDGHGAFEIVPLEAGTWLEHANSYIPPSPEAKIFKSNRGDD